MAWAMDHRGSLRRQAYAKLAALSTKEPVDQDGGNIQRLVSAIPSKTPTSKGYLDGVLRSISPTSRKRMSVRELDILLALSSAAAKLEDPNHAARAVKQLGDYLPEAHTQLYTPSPYLQDIKPSPWAVLTHDLAHALLSMGAKFPELKSHVQGSIKSYVSNWSQAATTLASTITSEEDEESNEEEAVEIAAISVSLVGFLDAAATHASFWSAYDRLELIKSVRTAMSEPYLIALEKAVSTIRHTDWNDPIAKDWKKSLKHYAARGAPLGAMHLQQSFMRLVVACSAQLVAKDSRKQSVGLLDSYMQGSNLEKFYNEEEVDDDMIEYLVDLVTDQMNVLEEGSDYLQLSSAWQKKLAFLVKAHALEAFVHCMVLDDELAEPEVLLGWCEDAIESQPQMSDPTLAKVVLQSMAIAARYMPDGASNVARTLLKFVVQGTTRLEAITTAAQSLAYILRMVSTDAVITTLYSLGNVLSSQTGAEKQHQSLNGHHESLLSGPRGPTGSVISLSMSGDEETSIICGNVASAIVTVVTTCNDSKIVALAQTLLAQKISRINIVVDARIIEHTAVLAVHGKEDELKSLLRLYSRMHSEAVHQRNNIVFEAVRAAREYLAAHIDVNSPLFRVLAVQLLERILSKGDVVEGEFKHSAEVEQAAQEIAPLLKPLAILASRKPMNAVEGTSQDSTEIEALAREAWYNIAVHGVTLQSRIGQQYYHELRLLAMHSAPVIDRERTELLESDVELNTVLRRGMSSQHVAEQKRNLISIIPDQEGHIRHLAYQKVVFLNTVYLVESLRAASGNCAEILTYFTDATLRESDMGTCLSAIAMEVVKGYIQKARPAKDDDYAAPYVAKQLVKVFSACCHRSAKMQEVARSIADYIISFAPSALIQKSSIFALLELLSIMWSSCLESEIDEYEWKSTFSSARGKVTVDLSDDFAFRKRTLDAMHTAARRWMTGVTAIAPLDVKGLLQTYLSEYDDTGAYGHVSLGRSFALEIGSMIPSMDQRLAAIEQQAKTTNVNVASDFVAQYTTRQEYRFGGIASNGLHRQLSNQPELHGKLVNGVKTSTDIVDEAQETLAEIEHKTTLHSTIPLQDLKGVLRRAAALLCRSKSSQTAIVHYLVNIPFEVFTKESIKMGISLWLGVIHENARMEPRILTEVAQAWETTIDRGIGIFSPSFHNLDPFYVKEEFAPSDRELLLKQAQTAQNTISPHLRLLQFFESHFNAIRLGSPHTQRTFVRMIMRTLRGFEKARCHPLMREIHFHAVLLGLKILQFSTCLNKNTMWRLKDRLLSTALAWFRNPPAWSFGGNRLQVKAEVKVMQDVLSMLVNTKAVGTAAPAGKRDNESKLNLLEALLYSEIGRLNVWLHPLGAPGSEGPTSTNIASYARTAWAEDPSLAVQLVTRFPSDHLHRDVRFLLCNFPDKALHEPNAIDILLGETLPQDLSFQLKYLLIWTPVNPCQATTYFLPSYSNHPFVVQYGVRALDSHSIDVTFFYVPQIVQALRYDALGYVERFIVEAGKFSQLFAHQILWNMQANAYKDDDATIEDGLKPTLDKVTDSLIASFTGADKDFYEREFSFFSEVTGISGKLKPFIKKPKPEKKAKIEEELRKIKVEVGVYLPSNPDGVVVGIDRKSGKPLQSHAKAPYMATFRIRKQRGEYTDDQAQQMAQPKQHAKHKRIKSSTTATTQLSDDANSYEIWQSAIFKVGDDCRQDVLALQLISAFRGIFNSVGLDVYVYPYRVTATAPGCGVIDVLPNSVSRDMLGRESVNGLHDYFITKYGGEHSVRYQEARTEFVKSMAAYSVISYLLQFKDRHNGNIMVDDKGHILHIDFGFLFDISPGGVRFERAPFKLTPEMLAVMGGTDPNTSQSYRWFEELTVKAFLCSRQYCGKLLHLVSLMLDSGLPCFKPETMRNLRARFVLEKSEKEAAEYMVGLVKRSAANFSTKVYDEFQLLTNGIPY
ncbi:phosphatidylinositol-4- kinase [Knufia obscura]|uniref:1-phosphatidylinositol 4-kinase n=1 Tax=Knufia obscura TaxID=1635080 RepID=A0ABR0R7V0_9EURO|nr:phosphatidylinositol-4- kinase [Knufia obscura]